MKVKDLEHEHPIIFERCLELIKETGLGYYPQIDDIHTISNWEKTKEGIEIWNQVSMGNFEPFYEFHKTNNNLKSN